MSQFGKYSEYYDLLYEDKDYEGETAYVDSLLKETSPVSSFSLLELGCGTGKHAILLAQKGYQVTGVDVSKKMLTEAEERKKTLSSEAQPTFVFGDVRSVRIQKKFDIVVSLFHVMSYQTTNKDICDAFETASVHCKDGGIFLFDVWYGPAVLTQLPETRIKRLRSKTVEITRLAESNHFPNKNLVEVNYEVWIKDIQLDRVDVLKEKHPMRYFFTPELEFLLASSGFSILKTEEWMTGKKPGTDTWGVVFVAQKNASVKAQ
ncbi:class I SAM-dependent methyltransferase [Leptospira sp. WS92.C1]